MDRVEKILNETVGILLKEADPQRIVLFGSRAKKRNRKGSDIDIFVKTSTKMTLRQKRKIREKVDEIAGIYTVDLVFSDEAEINFEETILKEARILYEKK